MNFTLLCKSQLQVQLCLQLLLLAYSDQLISSGDHLKWQKKNVRPEFPIAPQIYHDMSIL